MKEGQQNESTFRNPGAIVLVQWMTSYAPKPSLVESTPYVNDFIVIILNAASLAVARRTWNDWESIGKPIGAIINGINRTSDA